MLAARKTGGIFAVPGGLCAGDLDMAKKHSAGWITDKALEAAWDHVRRGANSPGVDGMDLASFEADLTAQLRALHADIRSCA